MSNDQFKLSATLLGHESDVKALVFPNDDSIVSSSRDGSARLWRFSAKDPVDQANVWAPSTLYHATPYLNSVAWLGATASDESDIVLSGDQTGKIHASLSVEGSSEALEPLYALTGHESNVCALDSKYGIIASGSWDKTARVWEDGKEKHVLKGHEQAVWCVAILSKSMILTGSADKTIKLWKDGSLVRTFKGHTDAVRGIDVLSDTTFVSCSNDASIRVWSIDSESCLTEMYGHTSYIYSVKALPNGDIVSSGEDRSVRIWRDNDTIQVITLPCISLWSVAVNSKTGDFAVGSSDYIIRVFTRSEDRFAPASEIAAFEESVANSGIGKDQMESINKESLSGPEGLKEDGSKEGDIKLIRNEDNTVVAYQWSARTWVKIGEVVGQGSTSSKKTFNGKEYDYVFDVDVTEGAPPLKLPYNITENPYDAARRFLEANELPAEYLDQVAKFITTNSEGVDLGAQAPAADPYGSRYIPGGGKPTESAPATSKNVATKVVPIREFVKLVSYQAGPIAKAVTTFNAKQEASKQLTEIQLSIVSSALASLNGESAGELYTIVTAILNQWDVPSMLPALDILRIIIPELNTFAPLALVQQLLSCLDADIPKHSLLAIRGLVNLFSTGNNQVYKLLENPSVKNTAFNTIEKLLETGSSAASNIAFASLCLNYAVLSFNSNSSTQNADDLLKNYSKYFLKLSDQESQYRMLLAVGTLLKISSDNGKNVVRDFINSNKLELEDQRMQEVAADIQAML